MDREKQIVLDVASYVRHGGGDVIAQNYYLVPPYMQFGEGDLLCRIGGMFVAIECKFMGSVRGKTARTRRNKHRKKLAEQAFLHAAFVKLRNPSDKVRAATVTDEDAHIVCDNITLDHAIRLVMERVKYVDSGYIPQCSVGALHNLFKQIPTCVLSAVKCSDDGV